MHIAKASSTGTRPYIGRYYALKLRRSPPGSTTGNMQHATDQTCIFHVLYFPLDKSARGLLIIWGTDLHHNIPCLHLTTRCQGKVHWKWQLYCVLMRWEAKFKNLSNETKADLVMMDDVSTRFSRGRFKGNKLRILITNRSSLLRCLKSPFLGDPTSWMQWQKVVTGKWNLELFSSKLWRLPFFL